MKSVLREGEHEGKDNCDESMMIFSLIYEENWLALSDYLVSVKSTGESTAPHNYLASQGRNALHLACALHPPCFIIHQLVEYCPGSLCDLDEYHQTPLHIAVLWGASANVVSYLLGRFVEAAIIKDKMGKIPLHLSWEGGCFDSKCDCSHPARKVDVIKELAYASPESVNMRDEDGINALEGALAFEADPRIIRALQKATRRAIRRMEKPLKTTVEGSTSTSNTGRGARRRRSSATLTNSMKTHLR